MPATARNNLLTCIYQWLWWASITQGIFMGIPEFNDRKLRLIMMLAMLVVILAGIKAAADIVVPFLLAVFLAIVLNPLVLLLERFRVPRALG